MLRKVRESAELSYAREQYLIELDRRILFLLQDRGPLVPADISSAVGVDKAQVSRSVKRLLELRLVEREQIRAPLRLTRDGERLGARLMRMAELRNRELTLDISEDELSAFFDVVEILLDRAMALYEQERELAQGSGAAKNGDPLGKGFEGKPGEKAVIDRSRIISPMMTLSAYFSRSGALAFKRLTGLSTFEAFVLSEIGMQPADRLGRAGRRAGTRSQPGRAHRQRADVARIGQARRQAGPTPWPLLPERGGRPPLRGDPRGRPAAQHFPARPAGGGSARALPGDVRQGAPQRDRSARSRARFRRARPALMTID